jgi:2,3-bisphosphoglycerate-independent phosphoglycerate mutase
MESAYHHRILLIFVDGVGLAPATGDNPMASEPMPAVRELLGGPLTLEQRERPGLVALDACLGVDGLPQSATGQAALFTGINAPAELGRHVPALPGPRLRRIVDRHGLLGRLRRAERTVAFANAYSGRYLRALAAGRRPPSVTTFQAVAAGVGLRSLADLEAGRAVSWDVTGDLFTRLAGEAAPRPTPEEAGRRLAALAAGHHLTVYETFLTDLAGHRRWGVSAAEALRRVDGLLAGVLAAAPLEVTVLLTSDHGNVEATGHRRHTRNRVPLLVHGPLASRFEGLRELTEVAPVVYEALTG